MNAPDASLASDRPPPMPVGTADEAKLRSEVVWRTPTDRASRPSSRWHGLWQACVLCAIFALCGSLQASTRETAASPGVRERDRQLLDDTLANLAPQRPGAPDLYVVGFAGDSEENVFRNEVRYLETLMAQRFGARDRVVTLINHRDSLMTAPRPLATLGNLRKTLAALGKRMDPEQDVLLLFMTMHGTQGHELFVQMVPGYLDLIDPQELRVALDDAGIRNRVLVISACYSGGFVPALESDDTLILTASRKNRPSFGCGTESNITYFGRAWLLEGLNQTTDFVAAFEGARARIAEREKAEDFKPSFPQIDVGANILPRLQAWQTQLQAGPVLAYPYPDEADPSGAATSAAKKTLPAERTTSPQTRGSQSTQRGNPNRKP
jgi:Peptidase C13 family